MESKKFPFGALILAVVVFAGLFLIQPVQGVVQSVVVLPDPLVVLIQSAAVFVVGWAFAQIGAALPWFTKLFGQYADEIAFAISGAVLATAQTYLDMIPPLWETPANLFLAFVVAVLTAIQVFRLLGKARVHSSFRA